MARFLVLPGFLQSGKILAEKSSGFRKLMTKLDHKLEYIDPPQIIEDYKELRFSLGDTEQECEERWNKIVQSGSNRCWFKQDNEKGYIKFEESYDFLVNYLKTNGPYDGIIGFSQGAGMLLVVLNNPEFKFKACISFSGFCLTVPSNDNYDRVNIHYQIDDPKQYVENNMIHPDYINYYTNASPNCKIFNIYGDSDMLVPKIRASFINATFPNVEDFEFEGGHMLPNKKPFLRPLIDKIQHQLQLPDLECNRI